MPFSERDYRLSMEVSPRGRQTTERPLRTLLIHRLDETDKLIYRVSLANEGKASFYCERCRRWFPAEEPEEEVRCPNCHVAFEIEFAIYTAVLDEENE